MLWQPSLPDRYLKMDDEMLAAAIEARRAELGSDLLILGHHYQQDSVIRHADLTGDSLQLSRMAANETTPRGTKYIVFCGVHFMAETAEVVTDDSVQVILPDLSAGCSMADMADYGQTVTAWEEIHDALGSSWNGRVIPITYVNSSAAVKAFVGEHDGACCTSSNAGAIFEWAMNGGVTPRGKDEAIKILFLPDQHLGRNTASDFGLTTEVDAAAGKGETETVIYDPKQPMGGLTSDEIRAARVLLWNGHCSVHMLFRPEHADEIRERFDDNVTIIVHPECRKEVVDKSDISGSTGAIIEALEAAPAGSNWAIGTEMHLINRLAAAGKERDVNIVTLSSCQCLCTTMYRIEPKRLLWVLDNLTDGKVVNRIEVTPQAQDMASRAIDRMLEHVAPVQQG